MKLTDKQKQAIVEDYNACGIYASVARKHHVHPVTVKNLVLKAKGQEALPQIAGSKEIAKFMEERKDSVCYLIGIYLDELMSKERLRKAPINQIASAMGTVIDKFIKHEETRTDDSGGVIILPQVVDENE